MPDFKTIHKAIKTVLSHLQSIYQNDPSLRDLNTRLQYLHEQFSAAHTAQCFVQGIDPTTGTAVKSGGSLGGNQADFSSMTLAKFKNTGRYTRHKTQSHKKVAFDQITRDASPSQPLTGLFAEVETQLKSNLHQAITDPALTEEHTLKNLLQSLNAALNIPESIAASTIPEKSAAITIQKHARRHIAQTLKKQLSAVKTIQGTHKFNQFNQAVRVYITTYKKDVSDLKQARYYVEGLDKQGNRRISGGIRGFWPFKGKQKDYSHMTAVDFQKQYRYQKADSRSLSSEKNTLESLLAKYPPNSNEKLSDYFVRIEGEIQHNFKKESDTWVARYPNNLRYKKLKSRYDKEFISTASVATKESSTKTQLRFPLTIDPSQTHLLIKHHLMLRNSFAKQARWHYKQPSRFKQGSWQSRGNVYAVPLFLLHTSDDVKQKEIRSGKSTLSNVLEGPDTYPVMREDTNEYTELLNRERDQRMTEGEQVLESRKLNKLDQEQYQKDFAEKGPNEQQKHMQKFTEDIRIQQIKLGLRSNSGGGFPAIANYELLLATAGKTAPDIDELGKSYAGGGRLCHQNFTEDTILYRITLNDADRTYLQDLATAEFQDLSSHETEQIAGALTVHCVREVASMIILAKLTTFLNQAHETVSPSFQHQSVTRPQNDSDQPLTLAVDRPIAFTQTDYQAITQETKKTKRYTDFHSEIIKEKYGISPEELKDIKERTGLRDQAGTEKSSGKDYGRPSPPPKPF